MGIGIGIGIGMAYQVAQRRLVVAVKAVVVGCRFVLEASILCPGCGFHERRQ